MQQSLQIKAPRHSWVDSFAASDDSCPFSPRYRSLATRKNVMRSEPPTFQKSFSQPNLVCDKENSMQTRAKSNSLCKTQLQAVLSPRYRTLGSQNRKPSLQNVAKLNAVLSPRYANAQLQNSSHFAFSPRYTNDEAEIKCETPSLSEFSENIDERSLVFSPRYREGRARIYTPSADSDEHESAAKHRTVLALLENLDDSYSEYDDDCTIDVEWSCAPLLFNKDVFQNIDNSQIETKCSTSHLLSPFF